MTKTMLFLVAILFGWAEAALACQARSTPLELLFAPFFKGPSFMRTNSHGAQFAGRTTISSGSATQVVSTANVTSDSLIFPVVQAALPAAYITRNTVAFTNSAAVTATASTSAVYSGQVISTSFFSATATGSLGAGASALRVNSIVDGVSFAISTADSGSIGTTAPVAMWSIPQAEPSGIKVNTISDGGYFILGWADGQARPVDVTVMWEIKKPGSGV